MGLSRKVLDKHKEGKKHKTTTVQYVLSELGYDRREICHGSVSGTQDARRICMCVVLGRLLSLMV